MKQKAFTLVELLVVIAIVGLLASIVLVSLRGARQSASEASGEQFSSSVYHGLGADAIGIWNFDDSSDLEKDSSGNGNDGTLTNVSPAEGKMRGGAKFNGSSSNIEIDDADGGIESEMEEGFTIESWFNSSESLDGCCPTIIGKGDYHILLYIYNNGLELYLESAGGVTSGAILEKDRWHHAAVSCDGHVSGSVCKMYVDGKEVGESSLSYGDIDLSGNIKIGEFSYGNFDGVLDEVRLYSIPLSSAQIKDHYVAGAEERGLVIK